MEEKSEHFKSGFVALIGRPNVGKSTLLNALIGNKISIVSPIPQTTRHQIRGILNLESAQIVFVDTPGVHSFHDSLTTHLNTIARGSVEGCDLLLYIVDVSRMIGKEEESVMEFLLSQPAKIIMVLNKIDLKKQYVHEYVQFWQAGLARKNRKESGVIFYIPVSALTGKNIDELKGAILENLPNQPPFYDIGTVTDFPLKFRMADIIREKLFLAMQEELPHSLAVEIEDIEEKEKVTVIKSLIYVNRISQKKIVVGEKGNILKAVGQASRLEIEAIIGKKVFLELWVKVLPDWGNKTRVLKELGYWWV